MSVVWRQHAAPHAGKRALRVHLLDVRRQVAPDVDFELEVHEDVEHRLVSRRAQRDRQAAIGASARHRDARCRALDARIGQRQLRRSALRDGVDVSVSIQRGVAATPRSITLDRRVRRHHPEARHSTTGVGAASAASAQRSAELATNSHNR